MQNTRKTLLEVASDIFAQKGYTAATTREICLAANTNITSIHYHFKNKAGLYRAIFSEPLQQLPFPALKIDVYEGCIVRDIFVEFYKQLLKPFTKNGDQHPKIFRRIHELINREQFEPTGLVNDLLMLPAKNIHEPLNNILCHFLQIAAPDKELHRLAFCLIGIGFALLHPKHVVKYYAPELLNEPDWEKNMFSQLAFYAEAMINAEIERRKVEKNNLH